MEDERVKAFLEECKAEKERKLKEFYKDMMELNKWFKENVRRYECMAATRIGEGVTFIFKGEDGYFTSIDSRTNRKLYEITGKCSRRSMSMYAMNIGGSLTMNIDIAFY